MRKIIIGFSHSTKSFSPFSKALQWWDGVPYSHTYFQFESQTYSVEMVYQASSTMLNYMAKPVFCKNNETVREFELQITDEQYFNLMKDCMESAGLEYGIKQVFGILLADVFKLKKNYFSDKEKYHCSEWVAEKLQELGYRFDKELDLVKPVDIFLILDYENSRS